MAKVDAPLLSVSARGKLADALVYFPWKGRNVVRRWLKPTQPKSVLQGYVRAAVYAIGKWVKKVASGSTIYSAATANAPAGQIWNAYLCQGLLTQLVSGGDFKTASFTNLIDEYSSLGTDVLTAFKTNATNLGLVDFAFNYGYTDNIEAGCQLYFGAKAVYAQSIITTAPYNTDPASWAATDVDKFKTDCE